MSTITFPPASGVGTGGAVDSVNGQTGAAVITKTSIGLGSVDNTSDVNKPVSTAAQTALGDKVDKVTGKDLSTNDFTDTLKTLLELKKVKDVTTDALNDRLVITYTDDTVANLNINDIVTDVYVSGATLDVTTNVLTLTSTSGGADVTVNLSDFVNSSELTSALAPINTSLTRLVNTSGNNTGDQTDISGNAGSATVLSAGTDRTKLDNAVSQDIINDTTTVKLYSGTKRSTWTQGLSGFTGAICIELVNLFGYSMDGLMTLRIKETGSAAIRLDISGRWNASTSWGAYDAISDSAINVRFARDGSKVYLIIGEVGTVWGNTRVEIDNVLTNYNVGQVLFFLTTTINSLSGYIIDATIGSKRLGVADIGSTVQAYNVNTTTAGNTFNGNSQLVQTTVDGKLPAIDGSLLTGIATGSEHYSQELTPTGMSIGATWYVPSTSKTYMYVNDGTNNIWIDTSPVNTGVTKEYVDTGLVGKVDNSQVLTNVPAGALFTDTVYTHPTTEGNLHVPATSTTSNGKVLTAGATAGAMTWETPASNSAVVGYEQNFLLMGA
jgi:hypothetical protein